MGARVRVVGAADAAARRRSSAWASRSSPTCAKGLKDADIVMMLRLQTRAHARAASCPRSREYFRFYGLDHEKLARRQARRADHASRPDEPRRRDRQRGRRRHRPLSVIREQVEMGVAVRMAVLDMLTRQRAPQRARADRMADDRRPRSPRAYVNARLLDPASGLDAPGALLVVEGAHRRPRPASLRARACRRASRRVDCGGHCLAPGPGRHARPPARARRRAQGDHRDRRAAPRRPAASPPWWRCPTPTPVIDDVAGLEFVARRAREVKLGQDLPLRRAHPGRRGPGADRDRPAGRGRRRRLHRRRPRRSPTRR